MTAEVISLVGGAVLSLAFSFIPGLKDKFQLLNATQKRLVMLFCLVAVAGVAFGLSCTGWGAAWGIDIPCDQAGLQALLANLILAIVANQSVYAITPGVHSSELAG